jgi:hypothetical protein
VVLSAVSGGRMKPTTVNTKISRTARSQIGQLAQMKRRRVEHDPNNLIELPEDIICVILGRYLHLPLLVKFVRSRHLLLALMTIGPACHCNSCLVYRV